METIILRVSDEAGKQAVLAALRELQQQVPFALDADPEPLPGCGLTPVEIEAAILAARQEPGISLAEARRHFGI